MSDDPEGDLAVQTWDALKGASWPIFVAIGERTQETGVTSAQISLLFVLFTAEETMTPQAVAEVLDVTPSTVSGTLNPLEGAGLITRSRGHEGDRRAVTLEITLEGRELVQEWMLACQELIRERLAPLDEDEKRRLIELLGRIAPPEPGVPKGLADKMRHIGGSR